MEGYQKPFREWLDEPLDGWKLVQGYMLMLRIESAGTFPIIDDRYREQPVVCLNEADLRRVWDLVSPQYAQIAVETLLLMPDGTLAYAIGGNSSMHCLDRKPMRITTTVDIDAAERVDNPFVWAPGFVSLRDSSGAQFPEFPKSA
jgi:hypothetical protein